MNWRHIDVSDSHRLMPKLPLISKICGNMISKAIIFNLANVNIRIKNNKVQMSRALRQFHLKNELAISGVSSVIFFPISFLIIYLQHLFQ